MKKEASGLPQGGGADSVGGGNRFGDEHRITKVP